MTTTESLHTTMNEDFSRRRVIGLALGTAAVALAGCSDTDTDDPGMPDNESENGDQDGAADGAQDDEQDSAADEQNGSGDGDDGNTSAGDGQSGSEETVTVGPEDAPTSFDPEELTVEPGTTVVFEWETDNHNIVVDSQPDGAEWEGVEEIHNAGHTYEHTFEVEGTYEYHCEPHAPDMSGTITVGS